jgi:hypothetical protein
MDVEQPKTPVMTNENVAIAADLQQQLTPLSLRKLGMGKPPDSFNLSWMGLQSEIIN